jgi:hypothetical protein
VRLARVVDQQITFESSGEGAAPGDEPGELHAVRPNVERDGRRCGTAGPG